MELINRDLIEQFLPVGPEDGVFVDNVAHYTRIESLLHILGSQGIVSLRATGLRYLNDRHELRHGLKRLTEATESAAIRNALSQLQDAPDVYQVSFSGAPDELGQWRGYAANGSGCSVVADIASINQAATFAGWVIYDEEKQRDFAKQIVTTLRAERSTIGPLLTTYLLVAAAFMKHEGFRPEREYRLLVIPGAGETISLRTAGERLAPYLDVLKPETTPVLEPDSGLPRIPPLPINVKKILLGPGWQLAELAEQDFLRHHVPLGIQRLLESRGLKGVKIEPSRIPYDPR